jgi:Tol biopolymer transport system component
MPSGFQRALTTATLLTIGAWAFFTTAVFAQIQVTPFVDPDRETSDPSLSPDGKTLAFHWCKPDYSCGIYTRPLAGGDIELLAGSEPTDSLPFLPRWSPDG